MCQGGVVAGGRGAGDSLRHPILFMATGAGNLSGQDRQGFQRGQNRCHGDYQATWCSLCRQQTAHAWYGKINGSHAHSQ